MALRIATLDMLGIHSCSCCEIIASQCATCLPPQAYSKTKHFSVTSSLILPENPMSRPPPNNQPFPGVSPSSLSLLPTIRSLQSSSPRLSRHLQPLCQAPNLHSHWLVKRLPLACFITQKKNRIRSPTPLPNLRRKSHGGGGNRRRATSNRVVRSSSPSVVSKSRVLFFVSFRHSRL